MPVKPMRIPNREINIFNMSMLDVICGALGAFLIVTVVLFPSYQNKASVIVEEVGKTKEQNERLRQEIEKAKRARKVPPRTQQMMRDNEKLQQELVALKESQAAKPPSPGTTKNPPLLVWIAWTRPQFTKHFSVALDVIPLGAKAEEEKEVRREFMKGSLYRFHAGFEGSQVVRYAAPREKPHTIFSEGLAYALVANARAPRWYVTYTVSERSEFASRGRTPELVPVYGFAVYGNQELRLPEVPFRSRGSSALVGTLLLDRDKGLRFEKIMARK